jgi:predicted SAM-dependent methyltransferase
MDVRETLKRSDAIVGLVRDSRKVLKLPQVVRRNRVIRNYLASHQIRKLQIGAGPTSFDGWLSTDIAPRSDDVVFLDATKPFPFDDHVFDYVYSEHMIEHISWADGAFMLRECRRILKPGGTVRIATPDLEVLLSLYNGNQDPAGEKYIRWITDSFLAPVSVYRASFVINNAFRNWGHQFLYDGALMEMALREAGFAAIRRYSPGESEHEELRGIESHGKNVADEEMASFETMVFEGRSPA